MTTTDNSALAPVARQLPAQQPGVELASTASPVAHEQPDTPICCAACGYPVTHAAHRIERNGAHAHSFMNPYGVSFHIGCFSEAPGCLPLGPRNPADSWFPGYAWVLALCGDCRSHLGWSFHSSSGQEVFYGLILGRLSES